MAQGGYDDRTPVTRVLDMIDLPRNVVANIVFQPTGLADDNARKGALGLPVVTASDALKKMGVNNKIIRGVVGFVGDVAMDPLSFLGPAGWGLEAMDNAGRAVRLGKTGAKGIKRGIKDVSVGAAPRHAPTKELFDTLLANAPDAVKNGDAAAKAAYLSKRTIGDIGPGSKAASPFYYLSRGLGGDAKSRGGAIGELLAKEGAEGDAVRKFVGEFGSAAGPGIGKGGSQVAHIPFTDISAKVPGFTRAGRAAEMDLALAKSAAPRALNEIITPTILESGKRAQNLEAVERNIRAAADFDANVRRTLEKQIEASKLANRGMVSGETARLETQLAEHNRQFNERMMELRGQRDSEAQLLQELVEQKTAIPASITNPRELNILRQHQDEARTAWELAQARAKKDADPILARSIQIDADNYADDTMEVWERIAEQQTAFKGGGTRRAEEVMLGDRPPQNPDEVLNNPTLPESVQPMSLVDKRKKLKQYRTALKKLDPKSEMYEDMRAALKADIDLLRYSDSLHDITTGKIAGEGRDVAPRQFLLSGPDGMPNLPADPVVRQQVAEQARPILDQIDDAQRELLKIKSTAKAPERDALYAGDVLGQAEVDARTLEREVEYQRALDRLSGLRDQLEAATAQARAMPGTSIVDARDAARQTHFDSLDTMEQAIAKLSDEDIYAAEQVAESAQQTMAAYQRHYNAVRGAVSEARKLTKDEDMMAQMMARFLGTDERVVGRAGLAGPDAMLRIPGGDRASQIKATVFGTRGTALAEQERQMMHSRNATWRRSVQNYIGSTVKEMRNAFKAVGVKPTGDDMKQAASLLYAMVIRKQSLLGEAETGRAIINTEKFGEPGVKSTLMQTLEDAKNGGMFSPAVYGDLVQRLEKIADVYGVELLAKIQDLELQNGVLKVRRPGYFPNVATGAAKEAMARGRRYTGGAGKKTQESVREAFQKERSTDQVRFISQRPGYEGKHRRIFGFELDQAERVMANPGEIAGLRAEGLDEAANRMEELVADYREYLALPERPRFLSSDPFELGELQVNEGLFSMLLDGVNPEGGFMQTNMLSALGDRIGQHIRASAREDWSRYVKQFGVAVSGFRGYVEKDGKTLRAVDGSKADIVTAIDSFGKEVPAAMIGGQKYRPISVKHKYNPNDNPLIEMLGKEGTDPLYHEQVAGAIERSADVFADENIHAFLKGIDTLTREWKSITLLHPSWSIFNMIGDSMNAWTGGAELKNLFDPKSMKFNTKVIRFAENPEELAKLKTTILGQEVTGTDLLALATDLRVIDGTMMQETAWGLNQNKIMTMGATARGDNSVQAFKPAALQSDYKEMAQRYAAAKGRIEAGRGDKAKAAWYVASDRFHENFLGPWFRVNSKMSNFMRLQTFTSFMEQGFDARAAAQKTIESQFDYADMTRVESEVFRRLLPFYCVPDHSEILTRRGWKKHDQITIGEDVMTYNVETDEMEWKPCEAVHRFDHNQELSVLSNSRGFRVECTDDHNWPVRVGKCKVGKHFYPEKRVIKKTKDLNTRDSLIVAAEYKGNDESLLTPDQARLYGWLLTDGHWRVRGGHIEAVIYQSPKKFLKEVTRVAGGKPRKPHPDTGVVCVPVLKKRVEEIAFLLKLGKDGCEHVPAALSREAMDAMYEAMYQAEGSQGAGSKRQGYRHFASQRPAIRECFKLLCALRGERVSPQSASGRGCYIGSRKFLKIATARITREMYRGVVWCPQTANKTWLMRQNGTITITGNCWIRNNGAYQVRNLFEKPVYAASFPKVQAAIEEAIAGDEKVPLQNRPNWMRQAMALQIGADPDKRHALLFGGSIPVADVYQYMTPVLGVDGVQSFLHYFASSLNPVLNVPLQIGTGVETFSGRTIGADATQGDMSVADLLKQQIRPLSEIGKLSEAYGRSTGEGIARTFLGGRAQDFSEERITSMKKRELEDEERKIRAAINRQERKGQSSVEARVKLMQLYAFKEQIGLDVPKWAKAQIKQMETTQAAL